MSGRNGLNLIVIIVLHLTVQITGRGKRKLGVARVLLYPEGSESQRRQLSPKNNINHTPQRKLSIVFGEIEES